MRHDRFVKVAQVSDIPDSRGRKVIVGDEEVALWHVRGKFYAISTVCAHQHLATLHTGELNGLTVTCPMHGWTYSLETGTTVSGEGRVRVFKVLVEGDDVLIEAPAPLW